MADSRHKPDPEMTPHEFATYARSLLDALAKMALRFKMPLLAHMIDLAAQEAEHCAKKDGEG